MAGKHIHEFMVSVTTSEDFSKGPIFAVVFVKRIDKGGKKGFNRSGLGCRSAFE